MYYVLAYRSLRNLILTFWVKDIKWKNNEISGKLFCFFWKNYDMPRHHLDSFDELLHGVD